MVFDGLGIKKFTSIFHKTLRLYTFLMTVLAFFIGTVTNNELLKIHTDDERV